MFLQNSIVHVQVGGYPLRDDTPNTDRCTMGSYCESATSGLHSNNVERKDNSNDTHFLLEFSFFHAFLIDTSNNLSLDAFVIYSKESDNRSSTHLITLGGFCMI